VCGELDDQNISNNLCMYVCVCGTSGVLVDQEADTKSVTHTKTHTLHNTYTHKKGTACHTVSDMDASIQAACELVDQPGLDGAKVGLHAAHTHAMVSCGSQQFISFDSTVATLASMQHTAHGKHTHTHMAKVATLACMQHAAYTHVA
jgi:hypothetical protein